MARPSPSSPLDVDETPADLPLDADVSAVREMFGDGGRLKQPPFRKMPMPPNPSEPRQIRDINALEQLLPQVYEASSSEDEFRENMRLVLGKLFQWEHGGEPVGEDLAAIEQMVELHLEGYRMRQGGPNMQQRQRRDELQNYQDDWQEQQR